jgi:hypothetical protein
MFYECENILCIIVIIVLIFCCVSKHLDRFIIYFKFVRLRKLVVADAVYKKGAHNFGHTLDSTAPNNCHGVRNFKNIPRF